MKLNGGNTFFIIVLIITSTFSVFRNVNDYLIVGKWMGVYLIFSIFLVYAFFTKLCPISKERKDLFRKFITMSMAVLNLLIICHCIGQLFHFIPMIFSFTATADFDNPAGVAAALVASFPFITIINNRKSNIFLILFVFILNLILLFVIQSRVGIIGITSSFIVFIVKNYNTQINNKIIIGIFLCILLFLIYLFIHKNASTIGRLIIWKSSFSMIKDAPLFGHGSRGFSKLYMLYQANFLKSINSEDLLMLADNVNHPLSEYILILVNYGILGLSALLTLFFFLIRYFLKVDDIYGNVGLMVLVGIATLSLFSYPFRYPLTLLSLIFVLYISFNKSTIKWNIKTRRIIWSCVVISNSFCFLYFISWGKAQIKWNSLIKITDVNNVTNQNIKEYRMISEVLENDPFFLYNQAFIFYKAMLLEESEIIALKSRKLYLSYDTELLLGNIYMEKNFYCKANFHYTLASEMCPTRIVPLYGKFELYKQMNNIHMMKNIGNRILQNPVKINNPTVRDIRLRVKKELMNL